MPLLSLIILFFQPMLQTVGTATVSTSELKASFPDPPNWWSPSFHDPLAYSPTLLGALGRDVWSASAKKWSSQSQGLPSLTQGWAGYCKEPCVVSAVRDATWTQNGELFGCAPNLLISPPVSFQKLLPIIEDNKCTPRTSALLGFTPCTGSTQMSPMPWIPPSRAAQLLSSPPCSSQHRSHGVCYFLWVIFFAEAQMTCLEPWNLIPFVPRLKCKEAEMQQRANFSQLHNFTKSVSLFILITLGIHICVYIYMNSCNNI